MNKNCENCENYNICIIAVGYEETANAMPVSPCATDKWKTILLEFIAMNCLYYIVDN